MHTSLNKLKSCTEWNDRRFFFLVQTLKFANRNEKKQEKKKKRSHYSVWDVARHKFLCYFYLFFVCNKSAFVIDIICILIHFIFVVYRVWWCCCNAFIEPNFINHKTKAVQLHSAHHDRSSRIDIYFKQTNKMLCSSQSM